MFFPEAQPVVSGEEVPKASPEKIANFRFKNPNDTNSLLYFAMKNAGMGTTQSVSRKLSVSADLQDLSNYNTFIRVDFDQKELWKLYGVTEPETIIIMDKFGNKVVQFVKNWSAEKLVGALKAVPAFQEEKTTLLNKYLDAAREAEEKGELKSRINNLAKIEKSGFVGFVPCDAATDQLAKIRAEANQQIEDFVKALTLDNQKPTLDSLKELAATYGDLDDMNNKIKNAIKFVEKSGEKKS